MIKKTIITFLIIIAVYILFKVVMFFIALSAFGTFDKNYSKAELIENYEDSKTKISELQSYFKSICPEGQFVEIEFEDVSSFCSANFWSCGI